MTRLFSLFLVLLAFSSTAQCELTFDVEFEVCDATELLVVPTTDCTDIDFTTIIYTVNGNDGAVYLVASESYTDGLIDFNPWWDEVLNELGTAYIYIEIIMEMTDGSEVTAFNQVFITGNMETTLGDNYLSTSCGGSCFLFTPENDYWWNYSVLVDGEEWQSGYEPYCFSTLGTHTIEVININGCSISQDLEVTALPEDLNPVCEQAFALTNGELMYDETCDDNLGMSDCDTWTELASNWYTINSETYEFMEVGINLDTIFIYTIEVFADFDDMGCAGIEPVGCIPGSEIPGCYDFQNEFTLTPNTDYYVLVRTAQGHNFDVGVQLYNGDDPQSLCGCADPDNCLYNPEASISTECGWEGCTDPSACNYYNWAVCDDGSCTFGENLTVQLFNDANGNGTWDLGWFTEPALGNAGSLTIEELGLTIFPNGSGAFELPADIVLGTYTVSYTDDNGIWEYGSGSAEVTLPTCNGFHLGLTSTSDELLQVSGPCCIWMMDLHCEFGMNPGLWVENTGTVPLNGTFTMTFDELLNAETLTGATPYNLYTPGVLVWNIVDQLPGESVLYQCHIQGPGESYIGQVFPFDMDLELTNDAGTLVYDQNWVLNPTVVCAYDPNDKYTVPEGYTEEHYILPNDQLEYRIRFQNVGNFPAATVRIEDQLDLEHLDIDTFEPVFASHDFMTELTADGLVKFIFNDIQLPGVETDEPGSQGYVVYRISPKADIEPGSVINNTAEIYFDGNEPIITNTTWHSIFSCDWLWGLAAYDNFCEGDYTTLPMEQSYIDTYEWTLDGEPIGGNESQLDINFEEAGDYELGLTLTNPLCTSSTVMALGVHPFPDATVIVDGNTMTAAEADWYGWYLNGEFIDGATDQTYTATEEGDYHVELGTEWGCTTISEVIVVGLDEMRLPTFSVYPNPSNGTLQISGLEGPVLGQVLDVRGRKLMDLQLQPGNSIDLGHLAAGTYQLHIAGYAPVQVVLK